jgi:glycerol-3-phosphate dehydrogenase (NAD(P)+)
VSATRIAVFGAGAWGTALAQAFADAHAVTLWGRDPAQLAEIARTRENRRYLPGIALSAALRVEPDFAAAPCGVLTGPSFAAEVARGLPTAITLAAADRDFAETWVATLHQPRLRIYANTDVAGCEIGGAVKNVIAIAAGVSDGMGFGHNARAALITRGLAEIARLGRALGAHTETLMGLAGMGDLILTCTGDLSRNRRVGLALAGGKTLADILRELGQVAEGVSTAREVVALARRLGVEMPICASVDGMLHHGLDARLAVEQLLSRDPKHE